MEILIGKGINTSAGERIRFGQNRAQTRSQIGEPDKIYLKGGSERWHYFSLQIELEFNVDCENRLLEIEVKSSQATLFGRHLLGKDLNQTLSVIKREISAQAEFEYYGGMETYFYKTHWLELQFEINHLSCISICVLWLDDETPNWPEND